MGSTSDPATVTILHFNDVYNIEERVQEPVGGAARMVTAVKNRQHLNPMMLFSGDVFNPSLMSTITKGKQMIPVLNALDVQCAVYGNHDFDFGVDNLVSLVQENDFPWLMSNVIDNLSGRPLAEGEVTYMLEWGGKMFGFVGLVEKEWMATLSTVDEDDITFLDFVEEGRSLAQAMKDQGADYVIALTHMRWPNDIELAENVDEIDLILGGHDHDYGIKQVNGKYIIKSGTDFRQMSQITLRFDGDGKVEIEVEEILIDSTIAEDPEIKKVVQQYQEIIGDEMDKVIGHMEVEMDGRFSAIRTRETNLGNFVTDVMLEAAFADVALLNAGTLRSDTIHPKGPFKLRDLLSILPMEDPIVVLSASGKQVIQALENGVCQYPRLEGRFPQVAGINFGFDPELPAGSRIDQNSVLVGGEYIQLDKMYRLVTKQYLSEGKDGYDVFKDCPVLMNDEEGPRLSTAIQNHFESVHCIRGEKKLKFCHRQSLVSVSRRKSVQKQLSLCGDREDEGENTSHNSSLVDSPRHDGDHYLDHQHPHNLLATDTNIPHDQADWSPNKLDKGASHHTFTSSHHHLSRCSSVSSPSHKRIMASITSPTSSRATLQRRNSIECYELDFAESSLAPQVEGRIFVINNQKKRLLEEERMCREVVKTTIIEAEEL